MNPKLDRFDVLTQTETELIDSLFPSGADKGSPIPVEYQRIHNYFLNEKGIHLLSVIDGGIDIKTIYPIPFVVTTDHNANIHFRFFVEKKVVEVDSNLEQFLEECFHSSSDKQRLELKRFASTCIMQKL